MASLIQPGMHIESGSDEYEVRCTHQYEGFLMICSYRYHGSGELKTEEYYPLLTVPEVADEGSATEVRIMFLKAQLGPDAGLESLFAGLRSILTPSIVKVNEIPELELWSILRSGAPSMSHDMQMLYCTNLINSISQSRK